MKQKLLIGKLIYAGNLTVNGEEIIGCAIEIDRDKLESIIPRELRALGLGRVHILVGTHRADTEQGRDGDAGDLRERLRGLDAGRDLGLGGCGGCGGRSRSDRRRGEQRADE